MKASKGVAQMKNMMNAAVTGGYLFIALLVSGCASTTSITGERGSPESKSVDVYKNVFVAATLKNSEARIEMENAFLTDLESRGLKGSVGHKVISADTELTRAQVVEAVKQSGADSVLVLNVVKRETATQTTTFTSNNRGDYYNYHEAVIGTFAADPLVYQYEIIDLEANLFDTATEKVVWSVRTESLDPKKMQKEIGKYAELICDRLVEVGMFTTSAP